MPTSDRETCPACGSTDTFWLRGIINPSQRGCRGCGGDFDPDPDPALRAASLVVEERGRLIAGLVARAESAERDRDHYQKCAEAVSAGMLAEAAARLAAEQRLAAVVKAVFGPERSGALWVTWDSGGVKRLYGTEAEAVAAVARAVGRVAGKGGEK